MKISFKLDQDEGIDPTDPLGDIRIGELLVESTYLDSWFDVLIDGYKSLKNRETVTLEIWEEPEVITFEPFAMEFKISYGTKELFLSDLDEFYQSLYAAAKDFLSQLEQEGENLSELPILLKIRDFITKSTIKQQPKSTNSAIASSFQP